MQVYTVRTGEIANATALKLFSFSILYLFLLFAEIIGERTLGLLGFIAGP